MATFIKAGFWEKLCKPCKGYKGWLNLDEFVQSFIPKPTYKVYTALLTQSGGDFLDQLDYSTPTQNVTKGVTYNIATTDIGADFTNVGAPNNEEGTYFVAINNEIPNSWGESEGSTLIFNTGAPVATVLENTIGNVWFTYVGVGSYQIPFEACAAIGLTTSNSACFINNNTSLGIIAVIFDDGDGPLVQIYTLLTNGDNSDSILGNSPIEIRVYN